MDKKVLKVNGVPKTVIVDPEASLADVLREQLGLTGSEGGLRYGPLRLLLGHHGRQAHQGLRHQDEQGGGWRRGHYY